MTIELTEEQASALVALLDIAIKGGGLRAAEVAVEIVGIIREARVEHQH